MPEISDSVGDGGKNNKHDVALIEVMLRLIKKPQGGSYFTGNYDGTYKSATKKAISDYQKDKGLIAPATAAPGGAAGNGTSATGPGASAGGVAVAAPPQAATEKLGLVAKNSKTFEQLKKDLPAAYAGIRSLEKTDLVFLEHTAADFSAALATIQQGSFEFGFSTQLLLLATELYAKHKLALSIAGKSGGLRGFQRQLELYNQGRTDDEDIVTYVGPGESNHQWGRAADFLPNKVQWLMGDASLVTDDWWFNKLKKADSGKFKVFYSAVIAARDAVALPLGLFRLKKSTGKLMDPPHLQSYDQDTVNMRRSLVSLLNSAGVGVCRWGSLGNNYTCDYGIGGTTLFNVGKSIEIWAGNATVTKANVAKAHNEVAAAEAAGQPYARMTAAGVQNSEIQEIRKQLKADWQKAEAEWRRWTPLP